MAAFTAPCEVRPSRGTRTPRCLQAPPCESGLALEGEEGDCGLGSEG